MRNKPDNRKDGFEGYSDADDFENYVNELGHLVLHDTLACPLLKDIPTITVWEDNIHAGDKTIVGKFFHVCP